MSVVHNYSDGDEIFLFGFSRGAYTARSVAGLIGWAGLLEKRDMDWATRLWEGYRLTGQPGQPDVRAEFPERRTGVRVRCIGVWDTVGALGIPGELGAPFNRAYQFHDTELGEHVDYAYQALALDETRKSFEPAIWAQTPAVRERNPGQVLQQVWFPGAHSDVGGGHEEHGLSDVALAWMIDRVAPLLALDEGYLHARQDRRHGWGVGPLHESSLAWEAAGTEARRPFQAARLAASDGAATNEAVHASFDVRSAAGATCVPGPYRCKALTDPEARPRASLGPLEEKLRWSAPEPPATGHEVTLPRAPAWNPRGLVRVVLGQGDGFAPLEGTLAIELSEAIASLRKEIREILEQGAGDTPLDLRVKNVEVELAVALSRDVSKEGGGKAWVLEIGGAVERRREETQKITLRLEPRTGART